MSSQSSSSLPGRTLVFRIESVRTIEHTDARLSVCVVALVASDDARLSIEPRVLACLNRFIPTAWVLSPPLPVGNDVGYERINLIAQARVPMSELHGLERRLVQASEEGIELSSPDIDFSTSSQRFGEVLQAMRVDLYRQAERWAEDFRANTDAAWQVVHLRFGETDNSRVPGRTGKGAVRSQVLDPDGGGAAVSAERISLFAEVTLGADAGRCS